MLLREERFLQEGTHTSSHAPPPRPHGVARLCILCGQPYEVLSWPQKYCLSCFRKKNAEWQRRAYLRRMSERPEQVRRMARESARRQRAEARKMVLGHYSTGAYRCACCGESEVDFLTIDHVDGVDNKQVKALGLPRGSFRLNSWLIRNGFPAGYAALCMNCNFSKGGGRGGVCIHKRPEASL